MKEYEIVIGLETHIQLNTLTKIFCSCKADSWEVKPNTNICPVCSGLPGVLPVLNAEVIQKGAILAAAMHAEINPVSYFDRKNYFYPDLPKGFQITQFDEPIGKGGYLDINMPDGSPRRVHIHSCTLRKMPARPRSNMACAWSILTAAVSRWWRWSPSRTCIRAMRQPNT